MLLDASVQSGYLVPGAFGPYSTASFTVIVYDFITFTGETLTPAMSFSAETLTPALSVSSESLTSALSFRDETLEPI